MAVGMVILSILIGSAIAAAIAFASVKLILKREDIKAKSNLRKVLSGEKKNIYKLEGRKVEVNEFIIKNEKTGINELHNLKDQTITPIKREVKKQVKKQVKKKKEDKKKSLKKKTKKKTARRKTSSKRIRR